MKKGQVPFARYGPVVAAVDLSQLASLGLALAKMVAAGVALEATSFTQELMLPVDKPLPAIPGEDGIRTGPNVTPARPRGPSFTVKVPR